MHIVTRDKVRTESVDAYGRPRVAVWGRRPCASEQPRSVGIVFDHVESEGRHGATILPCCPDRTYVVWLLSLVAGRSSVAVLHLCERPQPRSLHQAVGSFHMTGDRLGFDCVHVGEPTDLADEKIEDIRHAATRDNHV